MQRWCLHLFFEFCFVQILISVQLRSFTTLVPPSSVYSFVFLGPRPHWASYSFLMVQRAALCFLSFFFLIQGCLYGSFSFVVSWLYTFFLVQNCFTLYSYMIVYPLTWWRTLWLTLKFDSDDSSWIPRFLQNFLSVCKNSVPIVNAKE